MLFIVELLNLQLRTNAEIAPNDVVERRTDIEDEYNIMFNEENPEELW